MTEADLAARAQANFFGAFRLYAAHSESGSAWERDGMMVAASGVALRSFNNVFITQPLRGPADRLRDTLAEMDGRQVPYRLRVREGSDPAAEAALEALGLEWFRTIPELALSPLDLRAAPAPLEIRRVTDTETLQAHTDVVAAAFEMSPPLLRQVFHESLIGDRSWRGYVGYAEGMPAAATQLFMSDGVAGIFYVATLEDFRRRGFGEAITRHAVQQGAEAGCDVSVLQASDMGRPIYERMGFKLIGAYRTFARPDPSGE